MAGPKATLWPSFVNNRYSYAWFPRFPVMANASLRHRHGSISAADAEDMQPFVALVPLQLVAGFSQQVWNVDGGQRIRAFDNEALTGRCVLQRLART